MSAGTYSGYYFGDVQSVGKAGRDIISRLENKEVVCYAYKYSTKSLQCNWKKDNE